MAVKNETSTRFIDEIRIVSPWTYPFIALAFLLPAAAVIFATLSGTPPFPMVAMLALATLGGTILACFVLLIGYVNRDAGRRGMSRLGWTLLAIFIPHALGIVLYFVLRKPRIAPCPQCAGAVQPGFNFCPRCNYRLGSSCPHCQRTVGGNDLYCPYCGGSLRNQPAPHPSAGLPGSGLPGPGLPLQGV
jgi:hypothetical protein